MAPLASLDLVKAHLKVETDDENDLLSAYLEAASGDIRKFYVWDGEAPAQVVSATLLMVEAQYNSERTELSTRAAERLLWGFRRWVAGTED